MVSVEEIDSLSGNETESISYEHCRKLIYIDLSREEYRFHGFQKPGFPDQADHNLTILWHHRNHTNFLTVILP